MNIVLNTPQVIKKLKGIATGTTSVAAIYNRDLIKVAIPLPSKKEQQAIAEALSDADALIESLERLIAKKRQIKQGAMQELLTGQRRLPGFSGEWKYYELGDLADPRKKWSFTGGPFGSNLKSTDYTRDGVQIVQLQNIGDGEFINDSEVFATAKKADELISCNIYPGDIILSKMGDPVARACIIPWQAERYLMCSDGIRLAIDEKRFDTYFVFMKINSSEFRDVANNAGTGSTRKRIGLKELRGLKISCPCADEQKEISQIFQSIDEEIEDLELKLSKSIKIKQSMMQELLTGRIRLL